MTHEATFQEVGTTDDRREGPRAILACGFEPREQETLERTLASIGVDDAPAVFAAQADGDRLVGDLLAAGEASGRGIPADVPRAVVLSGLSSNEIHAVMAAYRAAGLPRPLWASLTTNSAGWPLRRLVSELAAEDAVMHRPSADGGPSPDR